MVVSMLEILYEDGDILVCLKPVGIDSQSSRSFEPDMVSRIKNYLVTEATKKRHPLKQPPYVGVVHRLDKPVGGIMVYAKNPFAAAGLSKQMKAHKVKKKYYAVLCGQPVDNAGILVDYLWKDGKSNTSKVVSADTEGAKRAELTYQLLGIKEVDGQILSLAEVGLITGRHHQIRVQFSHLGFPLWGDNRYNPRVKESPPQQGKSPSPAFGGKLRSAESIEEHKKVDIGLYAYELKLEHPKTNKKLEFKKKPTEAIFQGFTKISE